MPVAVPGRRANAGGIVLVPLPVGEPDAARRLAAVARATRELKTPGADIAQADITESPLFPRWLARAGARWLERHGRYRINCYVTNVRGPRAPLYLAGARLDHMAPLSPLVAGVRLSVTVFSYADQLTMTLLGDGQLRDWQALVSATSQSLYMDCRPVDPTGLARPAPIASGASRGG